MHTVVVTANLLASLASAVWASTAMFRPSILSGSKQVRDGEVFFGRMYAARAIPFGIFVGFAPILTSWSIQVAAMVLLASAIQLIDAGIAAIRRDWKMLGGASVGAIIHFLCGLSILSDLGRTYR